MKKLAVVVGSLVLLFSLASAQGGTKPAPKKAPVVKAGVKHMTHSKSKGHMMAKGHHKMTKGHHKMTKAHHTMTKGHHTMTKGHHTMTKGHKAAPKKGAAKTTTKK